MRIQQTLPLAILALAAGCGERRVPAAELGVARFSDPKVSTSPFNRFSCETCHLVDSSQPVVAPGRFDPGYNLAGAPRRRSWWGGGSTTLLDAINVCVTQFMGGRALTAEDEAGRELDAYLEVNAGAQATPAPFTIIRAVTPLADLKGDPSRGASVYGHACRRCHGALHSGDGRLTPLASKIPDATVATFPDQARAVTVEKIRHGRFFNIGGLMPLYSAEAISDGDIADVLAYLGL
jgi:thiosulfate dehydrogenase